MIDTNIKLIDGNTNLELLNLPISKFVLMSRELFKDLKNSTGSSFSFPFIETFLNEIHIATLVASHKDKTDIHIVVHDLNTGMKPKLGFSIKSMIRKMGVLNLNHNLKDYQCLTALKHQKLKLHHYLNIL